MLELIALRVRGSGDGGRETDLTGRAAHRPGAPLRTTQLNQLLPHIILRLLGKTIVGAGELLPEPALRAAVVAHRASSGLMLGCVGFRGS